MLGATRTPEAKELLFSRQYFVTCAKAYRLQAIDLVYINFKVRRAIEIYSSNKDTFVMCDVLLITFFVTGYRRSITSISGGCSNGFHGETGDTPKPN